MRCWEMAMERALEIRERTRLVDWDWSLDLVRDLMAGREMPARRAMMAMTTSSSMRVKAGERRKRARWGRLGGTGRKWVGCGCMGVLSGGYGIADDVVGVVGGAVGAGAAKEAGLAAGRLDVNDFVAVAV